MKALFLFVCDWLENRNVKPEDFYSFDVHGSGDPESPYSVRLQGSYEPKLIRKLKDDIDFSINDDGFIRGSLKLRADGDDVGSTVVITLT